jgi:hypothetical protein
MLAWVPGIRSDGRRTRRVVPPWRLVINLITRIVALITIIAAWTISSPILITSSFSRRLTALTSRRFRISRRSDGRSASIGTTGSSEGFASSRRKRSLRPWRGAGHRIQAQISKRGLDYRGGTQPSRIGVSQKQLSLSRFRLIDPLVGGVRGRRTVALTRHEFRGGLRLTTPLVLPPFALPALPFSLGVFGFSLVISGSIRMPDTLPSYLSFGRPLSARGRSSRKAGGGRGGRCGS